MNPRRAGAIAQKVFLTLKHDRRSLALMLVAPVFAMLVLGYALGGETKSVRTVIVNEDEGGLAAEIIAQLDRDALSLTVSDDIEEARRLVREGERTAALIFPRNFTEDASPREGAAGSPPVAPGLPGGTAPVPPGPPKGARMEVFLDTTSGQQAAVVQRELAEAAKAAADARGAAAPVSFDVAYAHPAAQSARFIDYFVPGIMALAAMLFTSLLTILAFVGERTGGTLDRLRTTPATEAEIVVGYAAAFGAVAAVQGALLLAVALLVYDVLVVGSVLLAALIVVLLAVDAMAIGMLVSTAAQREGQAVQLVPLILLPTFLLSGIFLPLQSLPGWARPLAYLLPPTWAIEALRDVMLRGWGLDRVWVHVLVLAGLAALFGALAVLGLRRARNA